MAGEKLIKKKTKFKWSMVDDHGWWTGTQIKSKKKDHRSGAATFKQK